MKNQNNKYIKDTEINKENIDEIFRKIQGKKGYSKGILIGLQGGRDPITKEKMLDEAGNSTARKIKKLPIVIDNRNKIYKEFGEQELININKKHIIEYDKFYRNIDGDEKNEEK